MDINAKIKKAKKQKLDNKMMYDAKDHKMETKQMMMKEGEMPMKKKMR